MREGDGEGGKEREGERDGQRGREREGEREREEKKEGIQVKEATFKTHSSSYRLLFFLLPSLPIQPQWKKHTGLKPRMSGLHYPLKLFLTSRE
jgi:hypothetical protein